MVIVCWTNEWYECQDFFFFFEKQIFNEKSSVVLEADRKFWISIEKDT